MIHHQMQQPYNGATNVAVAPYHPSMVYPLMNTATHSQGNRQHYFPSSLVHHQLNNAHVRISGTQPSLMSLTCFIGQQYVSSPWSLVTNASATNRGTPERETVNIEMPSNRIVAAPHSPNRLSCLYGPSLPSPFLTGMLTLSLFYWPC